MSRAVCHPVVAMDGRLCAPPGPGQVASCGDSHLRALQHNNVAVRTAATSLGDCFALIIPYFAFRKFSSVFVHMSNPSLKSGSINQL